MNTMKKIVLLFIAIVFPLTIIADITGAGTSGDPYTGSMSSGTFNISSGTSYFHQITVSGGTLNIAAGATLYATATSSFITISGTGVINADGSSGSPIIFTSNVSSWSRITFSSSGSSLLDYCTIEKGLVSGSGYGGGILISSSNLTVSNCIIKSNAAGYGGGIFINTGASPTIDKCHIHSNTAGYAGGGLYIYTSSSAVVKNCLIEDNTCTNTGNRGGGGISTYTTSGSPRIINCTVVNNVHSTPNTNYGNNIEIHDSNSGLRYINCVVWGGADPCVYRSGGAQFSANHFVNSAVQSVYSSSGETSMSSYTNSFKINTSNTGSSPSGPFFTDPSADNWTLRFQSPCRDAGTTPSPTVPNDYIGNPRIGNYDIGAYEVQYSRWTGATSTAWSSATNWDQSVDPSSGTGDVIIPTGLSSYPTDGSNPDFTIGSGNQMIIEQGARVTLDALTNNGILKLNHAQNTTGFASMIINSYTRGGGGTEEIQLYLAGGGGEGTYKWHYITPPVASVSTDVFTGVTLDLAQFIESYPSSDLLQGWVAYDGYVYSTGLSDGPPFTTLAKGKGYNFWDNENNTFTFGGLFNTADEVVSIPYSGDPSNLHGFNLIGNPFSSGLDWDDIADGVYFTYPAYTSKGIYFTRDNVQCSYINGVGTPGDVTGIIPPMQGFFTKTYESGHSITLAKAARTHNSIHARYKGSSVIPLVRLAVYETDTPGDETVVRFDDLAKPYLDNDFDAVKMFFDATKTFIHTTLSATKYAINGLPFPETGSSYEIPVVVNFTTSGTHKISAIQLQGLGSYGVTLKDNATGFTADLTTTPEVIFSATSGLISDRFVLTVGNVVTDIEKPVSAPGDFTVYSAHGMINIMPDGDLWNGITGSVKLLDLTGKTVAQKPNTIITKDEVIQMQSPNKNGLYFVEISSGVKRYVGKVVVR